MMPIDDSRDRSLFYMSESQNLDKQLETAKEVIDNLVAQQENYMHHPFMQIEYKMQNFQKIFSSIQILASRKQIRRENYENV